MTRQQIVIALVIAVLAAAAGAWFYLNFERVPHREWIGLRGEAQRDPFLAAERLIERMGVSTRRTKLPVELRDLPPRGTLVLPDHRAAITPELRAHVLAWIEGGGHLIVEDENVRLADPILDALEVTRTPVSPRKTEPSSRATQDAIAVRLPHAPKPMRVAMHALQTLDAPEAMVRVRGPAATHLLHFPHGNGSVTVLNDFGFMRNVSIGANDHAEFVWQLVRFQPQTAAVVFYDNTVALSLWDWLIEHAWTVLAAGALLLALWLWRIAPRFGPRAPDPEPVRRRLLDHLRASGRFKWSAGGAARLAESAREAALRRVLRAQSDFAMLNRAAREQRLAEAFGLTPADVRLLVEPPRTATPNEFLAAIRVYQRIHERLTHRERSP